ERKACLSALPCVCVCQGRFLIFPRQLWERVAYPILSCRTGKLPHAAERVPTTPISEGVATVAVGRPRSFIWDHFHVHSQSSTLAVCRHCGANISRGRDTRHLATSGLSSHMKRHHPSISLGGGTASPSSGSLSTQSSPGEDRNVFFAETVAILACSEESSLLASAQKVVDSEDLVNPTPPPATDSEEEEDEVVVPPNHRLSRAAVMVPTTPTSLGVGTVAMGRPRSYIWDHFNVHTQRANLAVCRHCGANISRGRDPRHLVTSGLSSHMKQHHPLISLGGGAASPCSGSISTQSSPGLEGGRQTHDNEWRRRSKPKWSREAFARGPAVGGRDAASHSFLYGVPQAERRDPEDSQRGKRRLCGCRNQLGIWRKHAGDQGNPTRAVPTEDVMSQPTPSAPSPVSTPQRPPGAPPLGRPRTFLWDHFEVHSQQSSLAVCRHCGMHISRGKDMRHLSTTGLRYHMKRHHPSIPLGGGSLSPASSTLSSPFSPLRCAGRGSQLTLDHWGHSTGRKRTGGTAPTVEQITQRLGEMLALDHHPFRMVEQEGFVRFVELLCPQYKIPSRQTFSRTVIPGLYEACKVRVEAMLRSALGGHIHYTSDIWTSVGGGHSYLSLTAHWWDKGDSMETGQRWALLALEGVDRDHKAETICKISWDAGVLSMSVTLKLRATSRAVESAGFTNVTCLAHLLHNMVKDAFKSTEEQQQASTGGTHLSQLIERCRKIAGFFHRSIKAARELRDRQKLEGLPQHKLLQDVSTRWNSTFKMLERMVEQQKAVHGISLSLVASTGKLVPSKQEWDTISQLVEVLRPFKEATETLSAQGALLSQGVLLVLALKRHLEMLGGGRTLDSLASNLTPQVQEVVRRLTVAVRKRLEPLQNSYVHMIAAICDPRLKDTVCSKDYLEWKARLVNLVREEECVAAGGEQRCQQQGQQQQPRQDLFGKMCSVNRYFEEPQKNLSCDPLAYWSSREHVWPHLVNVARKFLSCLPTSVDVVTPHRSLLDPLSVEKLVFLKANLPVLNFPELPWK
uniref:BED-type domain-containing protein n=1 Tax=Anolis carolinensis TaxID=28377 RepID=A0A803TRE2_ANOCA